jgi:adenylate kinase
MSREDSLAGQVVVSDLEIKDARLIFNSVWEELEEEIGHENLRFPKEIILLGGAPGAGKGTNTGFIMKARGFTCPPIVVSSLLTSPEAKSIIDRGMMVGDKEVVGILFRRMQQPEFLDGAVLDGFPRTTVQVECMKLLVDKLNALHREFRSTSLARHFRAPVIHVMVLFVSEKTSIERQLVRGREMIEYNEKVESTGVGTRCEIRKTDLDPGAAGRRYQVFKEKTWGALQSLKEIFFYHFINAEGSLEEVEQNILAELRYQSSLELELETYDMLRDIPLASEIVLHARQELVKRLDGYVVNEHALFREVCDMVVGKFMPIVKHHAISGEAVINTEAPVFRNPQAIAMLIDIFSERGYRAVVDKHMDKIPARVDLSTGEIEFERHSVYTVRVGFRGSEIRRG